MGEILIEFTKRKQCTFRSQPQDLFHFLKEATTLS